MCLDASQEKHRKYKINVDFLEREWREKERRCMESIKGIGKHEVKRHTRIPLKCGGIFSILKICLEAFQQKSHRNYSFGINLSIFP